MARFSIISWVVFYIVEVEASVRNVKSESINSERLSYKHGWLDGTGMRLLLGLVMLAGRPSRRCSQAYR